MMERYVEFAAFATSVATLFLHLVFASVVFADSMKEYQKHGTTKMVGSGIWTLSTLVGGVLVAGLYWLLHHSALREDET